MDKDRFYTYLKDGVQGTSEEQEDLVAILEQYPYFQSARVMLSKSYYLSGHHEFDLVLQQAAIHVGDRSYLFQEHTKELLSKTIAQVEAEMEELPLETESSEEKVKVSVSEPEELEEQDDVEQDKVVQEETEHRANPEEVIEVEEDDSLQPEEKESHNTKEDRKKFDEMNELDQEVLLGALSSSISQELREHEEGEENDAAVEEEVSQEVESTSIALQPSSKTSTEESEEGLSMFASWVYSRAKGMQYGEGVHEVSSSSIGAASEAKSGAEESEASSSAESSEPESKGDIIDAFIRNEPKITPRRSMDVDPPEVVAKALVQDEEWVTETLAQVYAKQGNLGKARKAYKLLALKYPEKSVYFANQIKKLGNQSNK
jgi:hypothetical protein